VGTSKMLALAFETITIFNYGESAVIKIVIKY